MRAKQIPLQLHADAFLSEQRLASPDRNPIACDRAIGVAHVGATQSPLDVTNLLVGAREIPPKHRVVARFFLGELRQILERRIDEEFAGRDRAGQVLDRAMHLRHIAVRELPNDLEVTRGAPALGVGDASEPERGGDPTRHGEHKQRHRRRRRSDCEARTSWRDRRRCRCARGPGSRADSSTSLRRTARPIHIDPRATCSIAFKMMLSRSPCRCRDERTISSLRPDAPSHSAAPARAHTVALTSSGSSALRR